jgi:hypothetical protein
MEDGKHSLIHLSDIWLGCQDITVTKKELTLEEVCHLAPCTEHMFPEEGKISTSPDE